MIDLDDIEVVDSEKLLKGMFDYLGGLKVFAFDFETRSADYGSDPKGALNRMRAQPDLFSASSSDRAFVVTLGMVTQPNVPLSMFNAYAKPVMENPNILHDGWNWSFDASQFANHGVWVSSYRDWMVAAALLDDNRPKSLKDRCTDVGMTLNKFNFKEYWTARYRHQFNPIEYTPAGKIKKVRKYTLDEIEEMEKAYIRYSAEDSIATHFLGIRYERLLKEEGLWHLFSNLRNPAVRTAFMMERRGIRIDLEGIHKRQKRASQDLIDAEASVLACAGKHFKISSPKEVGTLLYEEMGLPIKKTTPKGTPSTDAEALAMLGRDSVKIAIEISKYRKIAKIESSYLGEDSKFTSGIQKWGYIHPSFNTVGTKTGRWSSSDPNFMQLPRNTEANYTLRDVIIPSEGKILVGGDLSQAELRVIADQSQDTTMIYEYLKDVDAQQCIIDGEDPKEQGLILSDLHQKTADGCSCSRQSAKAINFGIIYKMSGGTLARTLNKAIWDYKFSVGDYSWAHSDTVTEEVGKGYRDMFFRTYPGVAQYHDNMGEYVRTHGYVKTRFGQKRRLPDIYSSDGYLRWQAETQGINASIQGHVGELMTLCMMRVSQCPELASYGFRLILQVHDEILGECDIGCEVLAKKRLSQIFMRPMEPTVDRPHYGYRVPMILEPSSGYSWSAIH